MTEDEMKTKWCPQSPVDVGHPHGNCIASACAVWRWSDEATEIAFTNVDDPPPGSEWKKEDAPQKSFGAYLQKWRRFKPNRNGYCGLAGAPT